MRERGMKEGGMRMRRKKERIKMQEEGNKGGYIKKANKETKKKKDEDEDETGPKSRRKTKGRGWGGNSGV